ncbi:zinc finger FYVE-type containing 26 spastizin [Glossina fuscipes fuscipes]
MVENYLLLLTSKDREAVQNYLQRLTSNDSAVIKCQKLLIDILKENPYPVIKLLLLNWSTHKEQIKSVLLQALEQLLEDLLAKKCLDKFFIYLIESPSEIYEDMTENCENNLKCILLEASRKSEFYLSLLSHKDENLISYIVKLLKDSIWQYYQEPLPSAEYILYQAMEKKTHFITLIIKNLNEFRPLSNELRFQFLILRLIDKFSNYNQELAEIINLMPLIEEMDLSKLPEDYQPVYKYFFKKFEILLNICSYIQRQAECRDCMQIRNVLETNSILEMIVKWRLKGSYGELKNFLVRAYERENNSLLDKELNVFNYYYCLTIIYDLITDTATNEKDLFTRKVQLLTVFLRQQKDLESLCQLLEDISQMVFLRYDVMNTESITIQRRNQKSSDTSYTDGDDEHIDKPYKRALKSMSKPTSGNFLCRGIVLHQIFNFLKSFITKKLHSDFYKMAPKDLQKRFQNILDYINNILWKYDIVENLQQDLNNANKAKLGVLQLREEKIFQLIKPHKIAMEKNTSDEDDGDNQNVENCQSHYFSRVSRRKAHKKYRRATFSGTINSHTEDALTLKQCRARAKTLVNTLLTNDDEKFKSAAKSNVYLIMERSIIPKILGTPEQLVITAMSLKNFNEAKRIIENFNLQTTTLNIDINHFEQQQQIRQKLLTIYESYQETEQHLENMAEPTTVEQIRSVAAKGFEVSKIISIIDQFAQVQRIQQPDYIKQLLNKHKHSLQYRFLQQFDVANLNAITICDLVLTLPLNRDITTSVLMIIKRQQTVTSHFLEDALNESSQFGPLKLLENLCDCLRLLPDKNLKDLLSNNTYSLRPHLVAKELEREEIFKEVFHKQSEQLQQIDELKSLTPQFQKLNSKFNYHQRFSVYMNHLNRLVKLRYPGNEHRIDDLLKIDPCDIIGDLIFVCNLTPLEIENNVFALNLNLVHIIALNICPEIIDRNRIESKRSLPSSQKLETIYNYISHHNTLLSRLLKAINHPTPDHFTNSEVLKRFLNLSEIEKLSILYDGNKVITALRSDHINKKLLDGTLSKLEQMELMELEMGLQEIKIKKSKRLDDLVLQLIAEDPKNIYLATKVSDIELRAQLIQDNFTKISTTRLAKELIETTLQHRNAGLKIPPILCGQLEVTLADITIYAKVSEVMQFETWPQAYDFGLKTPNTILGRLLHLHLYSLCYEWCKVVKLAENFQAQHKAFLSALLEALLTDRNADDDHNNDDDINGACIEHGEEKKTNNFQYLLWILETFPSNVCLEFWANNKDKLRSLYLLNYAVTYMEKYDINGSENYRNYQISLLIFRHLMPRVRQEFWNLIKFPLLIIEQLIMNTKFELLNKILQTIRKELKPQERVIEAMGATNSLCPFCFDKHGHIYDIRSKSDHKTSFQLGTSNEGINTTAFILLNFNLYQTDHLITNDCIDLLLRIYATKALDYHVFDVNSNSEPCSQSTTDTQQSLDSLCGAFQMPKQAPNRLEWVRDEEASHCMCCRRAAFTMLMRRHHCRRCGRVVCFACSTQRMRIPELYEDVEVRICNDCYRCSEDINQRKTCRNSTENVVNIPVKVRQPFIERFKWKLSGNITHDKLLREEFCYEHSPSVALCLSILEYHEDKQKAVNLLLYHCRKLENLMIPNPEVDYELVAKMMNCLAVAAKVRGAPAEVETILEHSEIIISVVQNGCESLIPRDPLNLRKLADSLLQAERWDLALEVHLKCGFPTAGVMAAHGLSCLKAGCFDTAREKFLHCMTKLTDITFNTTICKCIFGSPMKAVNNNSQSSDIPFIKRPQHGPPLLREILKLIESLPLSKPQPETLQRASIIRNSSSSLVSLLSLKRKDNFVKRIPEPALNILNTLSNLKRITKGQYSLYDSSIGNRQQLLRQSRCFDECLYYVLTYGSHADIVQFLMKHDELKYALNYYLIQKLESEIFVQFIYMESLKSGQVSQLIKQLQEYDERLIIWGPTLLHTCRCLETQKMYNSLYQLQILLQDPIRASMTCVKFYTMNCDSFQQQHANAQHLRNAHLHLQGELELLQWENINAESPRSSKSINSNRRSSVSSNSSTPCGGNHFFLQMDARSLNAHINTILRQLDVAKFLAKCEMENCKEGVNVAGGGLITEKILKKIRLESSKTLPTLFDNTPEKIQICLLILLCGKNIEEGFGLVYRIIQDYKLTSLKIFASAAKYLARNQRLAEVDNLLSCISSNNGVSSQDIDEILIVAINSATNTHESDVKMMLDNLTKRVHSIELRISSHIFIGQLKSAYLLANKYERLGDIRKILRQAEATNQIHIKKLCEKKLQMSCAQQQQQQQQT